jgi:hypothetical protein
MIRRIQFRVDKVIGRGGSGGGLWGLGGMKGGEEGGIFLKDVKKIFFHPLKEKNDLFHQLQKVFGRLEKKNLFWLRLFTAL